MSPLSSISKASSKFLNEGEQYVQKSETYYKLKIFQQLTITLSTFTKILIIGSLLFIVFVFLTVAGAIALSDLLGSLVYGCLLISLFVGFITLLIYLNRKRIDKVIIRKMSKTYFN